MNKVPCVCGHFPDDHFLDEGGQLIDEGMGYCHECWFRWRECVEYKLDNLKYLESKYEVKHGPELRA